MRFSFTYKLYATSIPPETILEIREMLVNLKDPRFPFWKGIVYNQFGSSGRGSLSPTDLQPLTDALLPYIGIQFHLIHLAQNLTHATAYTILNGVITNTTFLGHHHDPELSDVSDEEDRHREERKAGKIRRLIHVAIHNHLPPNTTRIDTGKPPEPTVTHDGPARAVYLNAFGNRISCFY